VRNQKRNLFVTSFQQYRNSSRDRGLNMRQTTISVAINERGQRRSGRAALDSRCDIALKVPSGIWPKPKRKERAHLSISKSLHRCRSSRGSRDRKSLANLPKRFDIIQVYCARDTKSISLTFLKLSDEPTLKLRRFVEGNFFCFANVHLMPTICQIVPTLRFYLRQFR